MADYTQDGGKGKATLDQQEAVTVMLEKYEIVCGIIHGFDYRVVIEGPENKRMAGLAATMEHVLAQEDVQKRYVQALTELSKAFALSVPHKEAIRIRDERASSRLSRPV